MSSVGIWTVTLALGYTLFLILGPRALAGRAGGAADFFVGGRSFSPWTVAVCITGLFSGSSFIAILELSYRTGVSALWYGVAEITQILLIALLLVAPLRQRLVVTVSGLIGDRYGRLARGIAGGITAFTFPMWAVATAIAFASALHVVTGLPVHLTVIFTALLLLAYLAAGGMRSVAFAQTSNCVAFAFMLGVGAVAVLGTPGLPALAAASDQRPELFSLSSAGTGLIVAWFGTFIVNVLLAQAAFQMSLSCRTPAAGRQGLITAAWLAVPFIVIGTLIGIAAALTLPGASNGLIGVAQYVASAVPAPLAALFFLGIWACALGWGGPCQFSGATSLGRDVGLAIRPDASPEQLVTWTRRSLVVLTVVMIAFAFARTSESAWWNVLAWTLRNGATLAPIIGVLFWPLATRRAALSAMAGGFGAGLAWYQLGGWQPATFHLGVHPVWIGMGTNLLILLAVTLTEQRTVLAVTRDHSLRRSGGILGFAALSIAATTALAFGWLHERGLLGLAAFSALALATAAATRLLRTAETPAKREFQEAGAVAAS
ncbi:sodium:solute symporter family protein [Bowdeniella massiliensis]|uniref:sodium:solute symporter family protein n=1 Tax=Bowdeniella massiliensis TaxID=2932264 RepID=UPI002029790A